MKVLFLALLSILLLLALTIITLRWLTSNRSLTKTSPESNTAESAESIAMRFSKKRPERALVMGWLANGASNSTGAGSDQEARRVDGRTIFELGSVTKVFTGLLLAEMVHRGEVELDWTLRDALRGTTLSPSAADITLVQLATHTSGLPRIPNDLSEGEDRQDPYAHYTRERLLRSLEAIEVLPSASSNYSNYGVGLLGEALAFNRDTTYPELLQERVLRPLGLTSGSFRAPGVEQPTRLIQGFMGKKPAAPWTMPALAGAGGLRLSMDDLLKFLTALSAPTGDWRGPFELSWQPHHQEEGRAVGLCWQIEGEGDMRTHWHNGSTYGASTFLALQPANGRGVAAMQNYSELLGMVVGNQSAAECIGRSFL